MSEKMLTKPTEEIADEGRVRLGDGSLYFDPGADERMKMPPADVADEAAVRLGDGSLYFNPDADEALED